MQPQTKPRRISRLLSALLLTGLLTGLLTACGGGGGGGGGGESSGDNASQQSASGVAQLGYIADGQVQLFALPEITQPIANTRSSRSTNSNEAGHFRFTGLTLDDQAYYLLCVTGGDDIDPDDNGIIDTASKIALQGKVYALATGHALKAGQVRINAYTDMAYQKIKGQITTLKPAEIASALNSSAQSYVYDIDGNGKVDQQDLHAFNPVQHRSQTRQPYQDTLDVYVPRLHNGDTPNKALASLMYLDPPRIKVSNGNVQEIPFTLQASLNNAPAGTTLTWSLDGINKTAINDSISTEGIYRIRAQISLGNTVLKTLSTDVVATQKVDITTLNVNPAQDSSVFITDTANSPPLAGAQIIVPQGALNTRTTLRIKKASINQLPTDGIGISDVLVLEPSGLTFNKPVQIRLPYDKNADLNGKTVRIARYSQGGQIDYLTPLYIDTDNQEIVFETEHFSLFKAETDFIGKSADEKFIADLNQSFPEYAGYNINDWQPILNVYIDPPLNKLTVYNYLKIFIENETASRIFKAGKGRYGSMALKSLYPNANEIGRNFAIWQDVKTDFEIIGFIQTAGSSVSKLAQGQMYSALTNSLGVPTDASDLSLYDPVKTGTFIIKSFNDSVNNAPIIRLLNTDTCNPDDVGGSGFTKGKLEAQGILWYAVSLCRRYQQFNNLRDDGNGNEIDAKTEARNFTQEAINKIEKDRLSESYKNNPVAEFTTKYPKANPLLLRVNEGQNLVIPIVIHTRGYDTFTPNFKLYSSATRVLVNERIQSAITHDFQKINSIEGEYRTTLKFKAPTANIEYFLGYNDNGVLSKVLQSLQGTMYIKVEVIKKKSLAITGITPSGNINANGDYVGRLSVDFAGLERPAVTPRFTFNGQSYNGNAFTIAAADRNNPALASLSVTLQTAAADVAAVYNISPLTLPLDLSAEVNTPANIIPQLTIIAVNGIVRAANQQMNPVTLTTGDSVTFGLDMSNISSILTKKYGVSSTTDTYTYTTAGTYKPIALVKLNSGGAPKRIKGPVITVTAAPITDTIPPTITAPPTLEISSASDIPFNDSRIQAFLTSATATDNIDGDLTASISHNIASGHVFTVGSNKIVRFSVADNAGNISQNTSRIIITAPAVVTDTTAPVITLNGAASLNITQNSTYLDAGATALDDIDGDLTAMIITTNPVDTAVLGTYNVTYDVSDNAGNAAQKVRVVNVVASLPATSNYALQFDGVDDFVESLTPKASLNVGNQSWVVSAQIKVGNSATEQTIVNRYECGWNCISGRSNATYHLYINPQGLAVFAIRDDTGNSRVANVDIHGVLRLTGSTDLRDNQWHDVTGVLDRTSAQLLLYVDGVLQKTVDATGLVAINDKGSPLSIGRTFITGWDVPLSYFNGTIDDIRIWNTVRSQAQIQADMNAQLTGNEAGLVAYWNFNEGTGTVANDATANANHGTLGAGITANMPTWVASTVGNGVVALPGTITTIAGTGAAGFSGDGGLATAADLNGPHGIAVDRLGNTYIADFYSNRIRKIDAAGIITTVAGNGVAAYTGDGGLAVNASLISPGRIIVDNANNLLILGGDRVRKIDIVTGVITTVAGNGIASSAGDGGLATQASLFTPMSIAIGTNGDLYIAEFQGNRIRKISSATGIISTVAGTGTAGYTGDGALAINAQLSTPVDIEIDKSGNLVFVEYYNHLVRHVNVTTGVISTLAGNGTAGFSGDDGLAINASFNVPYSISIDGANNLFVGDYANNRVRKIDAVTGVITTVAGNGSIGFFGDGAAAVNASFSFPSVTGGGAVDITFDLMGNLLIADFGNNRIRQVNGVGAR